MEGLGVCKRGTGTCWEGKEEEEKDLSLLQHQQAIESAQPFVE